MSSLSVCMSYSFNNHCFLTRAGWYTAYTKLQQVPGKIVPLIFGKLHVQRAFQFFMAGIYPRGPYKTQSQACFLSKQTQKPGMLQLHNLKTRHPSFKFQLKFLQ